LDPEDVREGASAARRTAWQALPDLRAGEKRERYRSDPDRRALSTRRWKQVRKLAAERDGNRCRFEGDDCYGRLEAHHIVAIKHGGAVYDLDNIAMMCKRHHFLAERETRMRRN
jgi:5-methylcytosine-specific restriction endonuclease McrA